MPMKRRHRSIAIQSGSKNNLNNGIARYWSYKILVEMSVWKQLNPSYIDGSVIDFLKINHLCEDDELAISKKELFHHLKSQLEEYKADKQSIDKILISNLKKMTRLIHLNKIDIQILAFAIVLHSSKGLQDISDELGNLSLNQVFTVLSQLLDISYQQVKSSLNKNGALFQSGLVKIDQNNSCDLQCRIELMDGLADALLIPNIDINDVFDRYFYLASSPELKIKDFDYIDDQVQLILRYLQSIKKINKEANQTKNHQLVKGINILFYGEPGTGKTELAGAIAVTLGFELQEITMSDEDGDSIRGDERFSAFRLAQQVLKRKDNHLIMFDEIEDVFPISGVDFMGNRSRNNGKKAWINQLLENNEVPTIWISNEVGQIDDAYKRRFKFILKMENPPEKTRLKIIKETIKALPVTAQWMENLAKHADISPAIISQTAEMITLMQVSQSDSMDACAIESDLTQILNNSLEVMGKKKIVNEQSLSPIAYNIDVINPDKDIKDLVKGLKRHQEGRLCLYGPAGTGKTAFGHHIASELDKKLLVKRASDLFGIYVGESEKNIAQMFEQAKKDDAVLLLDEADSFLRDRKGARQSWEVTQVNELLTQMEIYQGIFICSTNLMDNLDEASIRRFDLKIKLNYMKSEQVWNLFRQVLKEQGRRLTQQAKWKLRVNSFHNLTPGDFATVVRQNRLSSQKLGPAQLFEGLKNESDFKKGGNQRSIGFAANL